MPRTPGRLARVTSQRRTRERVPLPRDVLVLGVVGFFVMLGFGVVVPVLPVFVRSFHVGYVEVGAVVSAFALMRLVANPFVGWVVDRMGERTVLAIGIGIVALSSGLVGIAANYPQVLVLRGVGGIGSAMFSVAAMTLLLRTTDPQRRGRSVGFYQGGFLVGGMAGPAVGGILATISLTAPFFFYAATLTIAGAVGLFLLSAKQTTAGIAGMGAGAGSAGAGSAGAGSAGAGSAGADAGGAGAGAADAAPSRGSRRKRSVGSVAEQSFRVILRDRRFQSALLANFASGWSAMGVRGALVPVLVVEVLHDEPSWTGIAFAVAAVVQTLALAPAGRFVDTVGRRPAIIIGFAVGAFAMLAMPFVTELWMLIVLLGVYGAAAALMGTAPAAAVGDAATAAGTTGGRPVAVFQAVSDLGAIVGPLAAGLLLDAFSFPAAFASASVLMLAASLFAFRMPRTAS